MVFGAILLFVCVLASVGEAYVWYSEILWHGDIKRDPRNSPPPR
jgi:hypothetical protein